MKNFMSLFLLLYVSFWASAQDKEVINLKSETELILIGKEIYFLEDRENNLKISDIKNNENQAKFQKYHKNVFTQSATKSAFWIKIVLKNQTEEDIWLETGGTFSCWYIDFYKPDSLGNYSKVVETGSMRPQKDKPYPANLYWLHLAKAQEKSVRTYYLKMRSGRNMEFPFQVGTLLALNQNQRNYDFLTAGFVGLMLIMVFYNLFLYFSIRDSIYLIYVTYLFVALITITNLNNYSVFEGIYWFQTNLFVWSNVMYIFIYLFTISYLNLKEYRKIYFVFSFLAAIITLLIPFLNLLGVDTVILVRFNQPIMMLFNLYMIAIGVYLWLKGKREARYYTLGWQFFCWSIIIFMLVNQGIIPYNFFTRNVIYCGIGLEVFIFSLALADRINTLRREKEKIQSENLIFIKEQNLILEQKVAERTEEINQQREEIEQTLFVVNEQKILIEEKNRNIVASITYALRIQKAIIPQESEIQKHFPQSFVFFRPKDIVSGDFYFFADKGNTKILAVADCTGHGVSGAFMTMIGNNILNQIVNNLEILAPDEILNLMSPLLEKTLLHSEGKVKDGMDISILTSQKLETSGKLKMSYAGAMNPLYYVQKNEFVEIKADKVPIGGKSQTDFLYQKHDILLQEKTTFYLLSDGYQDQFGSAENRKFMVKRLKNLLLEISEKPMAEQKQVLEQTFDAWKGKHKQTDDVLVLGIRI